KECAQAYLAAHGGTWRNAKYTRQWLTSLERHVFPVLEALPVHVIDTPLVLKALKGVWQTAPETAARLRGRVEAVLDWATAAKHPHADNPGRGGGHLGHCLAARSRRQVAPLTAMPFAEVPAFMAELRGMCGAAARALEFTILTAARSGETFGARFDEVDGDVWKIPASRMKFGKEHEVPLSARCLEILAALHAQPDGHFLIS